MARIVATNTTGAVRIFHQRHQQAFLAALRARYANGRRWYHRLVLRAGRRGGKTMIGAVAAAHEAAKPKTLGWCVAPTYGDLHDYVIPAVFKVVPVSWIPKGGWSAEFNTLTLKNQSQIAFRSADDPERMRGPGCHWAWFDEARKIKKVSWDTFRPALTEHQGVAWFTTSPNGFDWVHHHLYKRAQPGPAQMPGYWGCTYRTIDNPIITQEEVNEARATMDPDFFAQEYEAKLVRFEGAVYGSTLEACVYSDDDADTPKRLREALPWWPNPNPEWPLLMGMDPGSDHPFAAVGILVTPQGLVPWLEYRKRMSAYYDHATELKALVAPFKNPVTWGMDRTALQAFIELSTHGITASAAENSVLLGIQRVQSWLRTKQLHIIEGRTPMLLDEMRTYHWRNQVKTAEERGREEVAKADDDLCDAARYAIMLWPELPAVPEPLVGVDPASIPLGMRWAWERERALDKPVNDDTIGWGRDMSPVHYFNVDDTDEADDMAAAGFWGE